MLFIRKVYARFVPKAALSGSVSQRNYGAYFVIFDSY